MAGWRRNKSKSERIEPDSGAALKPGSNLGDAHSKKDPGLRVGIDGVQNDKKEFCTALYNGFVHGDSFRHSVPAVGCGLILKDGPADNS